MMIPSKSYGMFGYEYIVPLVTKENEDGSVQEGLLLNLGMYNKDIFYYCTNLIFWKK